MMIFATTIEIGREDCFKHIDLPFKVEADYSRLIIKYSYSPKKYEGSDAFDLALEAFKAVYGDAPISESDVLSELPLNNHVTLSLSMGDELIGTAHRHANEMSIEVGGGSSVGFKPYIIKKGSYAITLSCHAVLSEKIVAKVEVYGQE
ncbi:MAG: hypothetical protein IJ033_03955 [Clostridia bacterium]|nr:hypothetical protein [Clostridia bacterium]